MKDADLQLAISMLEGGLSMAKQISHVDERFDDRVASYERAIAILKRHEQSQRIEEAAKQLDQAYASAGWSAEAAEQIDGLIVELRLALAEGGGA